MNEVERNKIANKMAEIISKFDAAFKPDELGYLVVTGKVELHFRDKFAFLLQQALGEQYLVNREWLRYDMTVFKIDDHSLIVATEFKAFYTFDGKDSISSTTPGFFLKFIKPDIQKLKILTEQDSSRDCFCLLFAHHLSPIGQVSSALAEFEIKYAKNYGTNDMAQEIKRICVENLEKFTVGCNMKKIAYGEFDTGIQRGFRTSILYWLLRL